MARSDIRPRASFKPEACPNHGKASDISTLACAACNTFKWNGVDMCGRVIRSSVLAFVPRLRKYVPNAHACTRKLGHNGDCKWHNLTPEYVPF